MRFSVALFQRITPLRVLPGAALCGERTFLDIPKGRRDRPAHLNTSPIISRDSATIVTKEK